MVGRISSASQASENAKDEAQIISDQDVTGRGHTPALDENLGAMSNSKGILENEPEDFMQGEVDVREQMSRTARQVKTALAGVGELEREIVPEVGALEEAIAKTERELKARRRT